MKKAIRFATIVFLLAVILCVFSYGKEDEQENKETETTLVAEKTETLAKELRVGGTPYTIDV